MSRHIYSYWMSIAESPPQASRPECVIKNSFSYQNICCGYSKEPSQWDGSFEHQKHMLQLMDKKIFTFLHSIFFFIKTYGLGLEDEDMRFWCLNLQRGNTCLDQPAHMCNLAKVLTDPIKEYRSRWRLRPKFMSLAPYGSCVTLSIWG